MATAHRATVCVSRGPCHRTGVGFRKPGLALSSVLARARMLLRSCSSRAQPAAEGCGPLPSTDRPFQLQPRLRSVPAGWHCRTRLRPTTAHHHSFGKRAPDHQHRMLLRPLLLARQQSKCAHWALCLRSALLPATPLSDSIPPSVVGLAERSLGGEEDHDHHHPHEANPAPNGGLLWAGGGESGHHPLRNSYTISFDLLGWRRAAQPRSYELRHAQSTSDGRTRATRKATQSRNRLVWSRIVPRIRWWVGDPLTGGGSPEGAPCLPALKQHPLRPRPDAEVGCAPPFHLAGKTLRGCVAFELQGVGQR